jgi:hypothetical protein
MIRRALLAAVLASVVVVAVARGAGAVAATSEEVRQLAERAQFDPSALDRLRSIDSVDGRPAAIGTALQEADGAELAARLRSLASAGGAQPVDGNAARATARDILSEPRFREAQPPRPFRGVLNRVGEWLDRNLTDPIGRAIRAFIRWVPGHETTVLVILGTAALALVVFVTMRLARRRVRAAQLEPHIALARGRRDDPSDLERRADKAEADGDFATAIRLRFVAGLLRLDRAGAIRYEPSLTTGQVRRKLRSQPFDRVSVFFESVAYGGRTPSAEDAQETKTAWRDVLQKVPA